MLFHFRSGFGPAIFFFAASLFLTSACADQSNPENPGNSQISSEQEAFWNALQEHCGNAYAGKIGDATPYYLPLDDSALVLHVFNCEDDLTHLALHIGEDRSRNLKLTKTDGTLQLKHDHRYESGEEEQISQYGGKAPKPGLETRQIFRADSHTTRILPDRFDNFWFLDFMDEKTLAYGVHWPKFGHSIRLEFDATQTVTPPPAPWGYD